MTPPTSTEGIEPTIRRIAAEVCQDYMGSILGLCLGRQRAPQEPAPVDESEAVRKAREEERAKVNAEWQTGSGYQSPGAILEMHGRAVDRAVHQARVDALRWVWGNLNAAQRVTLGFIGDELATLGLEREQAKTAGAKEDEHGVSNERGRGDMAKSVAPVGPKTLDEVRTHMRAHPLDTNVLASSEPLTPAETKGAPEQIWLVADDSDGLDARTWDEACTQRADCGGYLFVRADVVERRVAEAGKAARIQAALTTRHVLQAAGDEDTQDAARRVVAERDAARDDASNQTNTAEMYRKRAAAAEAERDAAKSELADVRAQAERAAKGIEARIGSALDTVKSPGHVPIGAQGSVMRRAWELGRDYHTAGQAFLEQKKRAEAAEARVRELEARCESCEAHYARAETAESELARVRAELADEQQKRRDSDRVSLEQLNMILTAREALELRRPK